MSLLYHIFSFRFTIGLNTFIVSRSKFFWGITFDAHPHSGWFFCLAPNGARRTNSHIIRITISSFINGYLKKLRKRLLKKSHSSKIGLTTIIKNAWTTSLPENFLLLTNLKFSVCIWTTSLTQRCFLMSIISFYLLKKFQLNFL